MSDYIHPAEEIQIPSDSEMRQAIEQNGDAQLLHLFDLWCESVVVAKWIAEARADERDRWIKCMEDYNDACDFGTEDGDCMGYEDCEHYLPPVYYWMKAATAIRGDGEQDA